MKLSILFLCALFAASAFATENKSDRKIASAGHCIKAPTIECMAGFQIYQNSKGCWGCRAEGDSEPTCIKTATVECISGYRLGQDANGCFHCVKDVL